MVKIKIKSCPYRGTTGQDNSANQQQRRLQPTPAYKKEEGGVGGDYR